MSKKNKYKYYCKKCNKEICRQTANYGLGMCMSCSQKGKKLPPRTKQHKENLSIAHKGKILSEVHKKNISKTLKGRETSKEIRKKISKALKGKKKKPFTEEHRKKISLGHGGTGIPYENYDLAFSIRLLPEYINWRNKVYKRDNYTCQCCGKIGERLESHHIIKFSKIFKEFFSKYPQYSLIDDKQKLLELARSYKPFWKLNNGQTLCKDCHKLTDNYKNN